MQWIRCWRGSSVISEQLSVISWAYNRNNMKTTSKKKKNDEMRTEYDFSKGERGEFYRPLEKGYSVRVHQKDGTTLVNHFALRENEIRILTEKELYDDA